jgi:hypothetical protein
MTNIPHPMTTTKDIQQCVSGFKTVAVIGGPMIVRVHESQDVILQHTKHRYFISVDFKFRELDALNIGKSGWLGCTKSEATREANQLAAKIMSCRTALDSAREHALNHDTFTNRYTVKMQQDRWDKVVGRYCAEFV